MTTPTSTSPKMGDYVPWASTARGSRECYTTHSSISATTGMHRSTITNCPRAHGLDRCEVSLTIPFDRTELWSGSIISSEPDTGVEMVVHITLTSLCEDRLIATATLPTALLPIQNQEDPIWQQRHEAMSNLKGPNFHTRMTLLARYVQYLFNI
jgi:hypothetical protein